MADDDLRLAELVDVGPKAKPKRLNAQEVDLGPEQPARVVFTKARRLDQGVVSKA